MAKADNASPFERHLEKMVLLVCLALLGLAVFHWVLSSPISLVIVDEQGKGLRRVSPEIVDKELAKAAANIQRTYDRVDVPIKPVYSWANDVLDFRQLVPTQAHLIDPAVPGKPIKSVEPVASKGLSLAEFGAALVAPPAPQVGAWIVVPQRAKAELAESVVAHGVMTYPMADVQAKWTAMLKDKEVVFEKPIVQKVLVQVQQQLADGQWGPWKDANCAVPLAAGAEGKGGALPTIREYDGKNIEEVRGDRKALGADTAQDLVLRPGYYPIWDGAAGWANWQTQAPPAPKPPAGEVAVWFHDDAGLAPGGVYRFRTQLVFVNPVLTYPQTGVANAEAEAKVRYINSKPSEPSEPTSVTRPVRFYLSGAAAAIGKMTVTVYARTWGQWVRGTFQVKPGEMIGGKAKVTIRDPMGAAGAKKVVEVDFTTGAVAVRTDFNKALQVQNIKIKTVELLYLDRDGKVKSRIQSLDDRDDQRKRLEDEVKRTVGGE